MRSPTRKRPKNPLDHIPEAVRYARDQAGLTQTQLADLCDVTQGHISEIEKGTRNAPPPLIRKLAAALNCPRVVLENKRVAEATPPTAVDLQQVRDEERAGADDLPQLRGGLTGGAA